jgi:hypothetical protein
MYSDNLEGWIYGVVQDYEYCVKKYPEKVKEFSSVKKQWQGLTKDEVNNWTLPDKPTVFAFCQFIEAKLKEKNT